jgi:hypothetical protein
VKLRRRVLPFVQATATPSPSAGTYLGYAPPLICRGNFARDITWSATRLPNRLFRSTESIRMARIGLRIVDGLDRPPCKSTYRATIPIVLARCVKPWDHHDLAVIRVAKSIGREHECINRLVAGLSDWLEGVGSRLPNLSNPEKFWG